MVCGIFGGYLLTVKRQGKIMHYETTENSIRGLLQTIFEDKRKCNSPECYKEIIYRIEKLGVKLYTECHDKDPRNCFDYMLGISDKEYALGALVESKEVDKLVALKNLNLEEKGILRPVDFNTQSTEPPTKGDLVIYYNEKERQEQLSGKENRIPTTHGGIVIETEPEVIIRSKWCEIPAIFEHKLNDVPTGFGEKNDVRYSCVVDYKKLAEYIKKRIELQSQGRRQTKSL